MPESRQNNVPLIKVDDLVMEFDGVRLFEGLSMHLNLHEKVTITGPSGCGKSTLLHCLLGFVTPAAGSIQILNQHLNDQSVWPLRAQIAYVPQQPMLGFATVSQVLKRPFTFKKNRSLSDNLQRVPAMLERLLLPPTIQSREINKLSGGEKQRIALLLALLLDRKILLLDEASSALDQEAKTAVIELLREQVDLSILSVSHDQEWQSFSSRVITLQKLQHNRP